VKDLIANIKFRGLVSHLVRLILPVLLLATYGCKDDEPGENGDGTPITSICPSDGSAGTPYELDVPFFFSAPVIPADNPLTVEGVDLGRHLFWETALSRNNAISCGSCHAPEAAFSDNAKFSVGVHGHLTRRNSMAIMNLAWNNKFFWDGRALTLEEQLLEPVAHPQEMDLTWPEAVSRIAESPLYQEKFTGAFGTPCVDSVRITYALAQFIRTMISADSKFDRALRTGGAVLTISEQRGLELFLAEAGDPQIFPGGQNGGDCFHCHGGALIEFTDHGFHNNGLDSVLTDLGRAEVTGQPYDAGVFKTPSLRNIALTAPYMHDGRFATLREVIEHYNSGGHPSPTLDPLMKMQGTGLGLSEVAIDDLVHFLETLTDTEFVANESFSNPH